MHHPDQEFWRSISTIDPIHFLVVMLRFFALVDRAACFPPAHLYSKMIEVEFGSLLSSDLKGKGHTDFGRQNQQNLLQNFWKGFGSFFGGMLRHLLAWAWRVSIGFQMSIVCLLYDYDVTKHSEVGARATRVLTRDSKICITRISQ